MYCSESATSADDKLAGSAATNTRYWILLEFGHPWGSDGIMSDALMGTARDTLTGWLAAVPGSRFQLIRRPRTKSGQPMSLFLGCSDPQEPWLVRLQLDKYDDVAKYSYEEIVRDSGHPTAEVVTEPMHLVCTHGKHDRCCAKWGNPLFQAMAGLDGENVWQTSHLGGHRFAPTTLTLPFGICYGRLETGDAKSIVSATAAQQFFSLDKLRGRTCFAAHEQAAELFLRQKTGDIGFGGLSLESSWEIDEGHYGVCFRRPDGEHLLEVKLEKASGLRISSCTDSEATVPVTNWQLVG